MKAKVFTNVPGVTATFDGRRIRVSVREDDARHVTLERREGAWAVLAPDGARIGDMSSLEEAAVAAAGLRPYIARLMRGALDAVKQTEGEPAPTEECWEYGELREEGSGGVPLDALNDAGADGWEVKDVFRHADGAISRALLARRSFV